MGDSNQFVEILSNLNNTEDRIQSSFINFMNDTNIKMEKVIIEKKFRLKDASKDNYHNLSNINHNDFIKNKKYSR